jgi:hypothetical protein
MHQGLCGQFGLIQMWRHQQLLKGNFQNSEQDKKDMFAVQAAIAKIRTCALGFTVSTH